MCTTFYAMSFSCYTCYDPITRKIFMQYAGVAKPLATGADVSHASSCRAQGRRLVISPDLNALSFFELFFLYLSMIPFYPLVSVSHLAALYPTSSSLLCKFPFPEVSCSRKFWVAVCWASSVLILGNSEVQLTSCTGYIKVLNFLLLK